MFRTLIVGFLLVAVLFFASSPVFAGASDGPYAWSARVEAYSDMSYRITYYGGEMAEFAIHGDGDTDVDIFVYDSYGRLIVSNTNYTDRATVRWYPRSTQTYRIVVRNLGNVWNRVGMANN